MPRSSLRSFHGVAISGDGSESDTDTTDRLLRSLVREEIGRCLKELSAGKWPAWLAGSPQRETANFGVIGAGPLADPDDVIDVKTLTTLLGLNRKTVYNLIALGQLPGVRRCRRRIVVHRATVIHWLRSGQGSVPRSRRKP